MLEILFDRSFTASSPFRASFLLVCFGQFGVCVFVWGVFGAVLALDSKPLPQGFAYKYLLFE